MIWEVNINHWQMIEPILSRSSHRGRPPADARRTLNGILWVLLTGNPWQAIPSQYGSPSTCWRRFKLWSSDGTWERIWSIFLHQLEPSERQVWAQAFLQGHFIPTAHTRIPTSKRSGKLSQQ